MQIDNNSLVEEMLLLTESAATAARKLKTLPVADLNFKNHPEQWSALECIEHLNLYGEFYLPAIEKAILSQETGRRSTIFRSGILGNYFAKLMRVKDGKMTKMKTPADKNPVGSELSITTLDRFLKQMEMLKSLLNQARHVDLTRAKVPISLTTLIKLRLGDTFRFFVYHIERHIAQAEKVLESSTHH